jgi:hypothetical protein
MQPGRAALIDPSATVTTITLRRRRPKLTLHHCSPFDVVVVARAPKIMCHTPVLVKSRSGNRQAESRMSARFSA